MTPKKLGMPRRNSQHIWYGRGASVANSVWKRPMSEKRREILMENERMEKKTRKTWLKTPRLNCWRYKEEASLDEPFEYREISEGSSRWRMNRVADKVPHTASVQAQIPDPSISDGPRAGHDTQVGYGLRASLSVCLKPSTTSFVNLGMALKAPAGMRFRIKIGLDPSFQHCTLPVEDLTTDVSGESEANQRFTA